MPDSQMPVVDLRHLIEERLAGLVALSEGNKVSAGVALRPDLEGLPLYEDFLVGYASARDPLFAELQTPQAVGPQFMTPGEWLPGARSVVSVFLRHSARVRESNRYGRDASVEWLHARIEGQSFLNDVQRQIVALIKAAGYEALCPGLDGRFSVTNDDPNPEKAFRSRWSERHVAYVAGLGTFSLSRGLITAKGVAGRFGSVVTTAPFPPTSRLYTTREEYCTRCGECIRRCPVGAISFSAGKEHGPCYRELLRSMERYSGGYYGCAKCQVGVPCETRIP